MPKDLITELYQNRKIVINPFFDQMPASPRYQVNDPKLFSKVPSRMYHLDVSPGQTDLLGKPVDCSIKQGPSADPELKFNWLPYVAGSITYTMLDSTMPVLTGKMTGCWLASFGLRGQNNLAHIGTDSNSVSVTEDVKNAWKVAANARMIMGPFKAFNPVEHVTSHAADFGAVNARGDLFGVSFDIEPGNVFVVKQVRQVTSPAPAPRFV